MQWTWKAAGMQLLPVCSHHRTARSTRITLTQRTLAMVVHCLSIHLWSLQLPQPSYKPFQPPPPPHTPLTWGEIMSIIEPWAKQISPGKFRDTQSYTHSISTVILDMACVYLWIEKLFIRPKRKSNLVFFFKIQMTPQWNSSVLNYYYYHFVGDVIVLLPDTSRVWGLNWSVQCVLGK